MSTVTVEEVQNHLKDIIAGLVPGEELVIIEGGSPIATLTRTIPESRLCKAGSYRKPGFWMSPDFDAPLEDFKKYME